MEMFWNIKRNKSKFRKLIEEKTDYFCMVCHRPQKSMRMVRCSNCIRKLGYSGGEYRTVRYSALGAYTINYQYYLSKQIKNYIPNKKFRGLKEDRVNLNLTKEKVNMSCLELRKVLTQHLFANYKDMYLYLLKEMPNVNNRILHNIMLCFSAYYLVKGKPLYKSEAHFMASTMKCVLSTIRRCHFEKTKLKSLPNRYYRGYPLLPQYRMMEGIEDIVSNLF